MVSICVKVPTGYRPNVQGSKLGCFLASFAKLKNGIAIASVYKHPDSGLDTGIGLCMDGGS
eukprot:11328206-Karenia_brevis.AAC.1